MISLTNIYYKCIDKIYGISKSKHLCALMLSIAYVFLLVCFAHIDVVFYCFENDVDTMSDIISRIVFKHAHILSLITNLGLLSMLFIDLLVANKCDGMIVVTLLNLLGVFAMIGIFWCSVGCDSCICNTTGSPNIDKIGGLGSPNGSIMFLIVFIITLLCLKFIALKPCDK